VVVTCVVAGCGASSPEPSVTAIEPAVVSTLVATPGVVRGVELAARASLDLDHGGGAEVDRGWRIRIDDQAIDAAWIDPQTIDVTIPRGLSVGMHDVIATPPHGVDLVLPGALTVTGEPVGLILSIEDAPGGTGAVVGGTIAAGGAIDAYAVVRDSAHAFVADADVTWGATAAIGVLSGTSGPSVTLTANHAGTGRLTAHQAGASLDADSGDLVVVAGAAARIAIVDAPGGAGTEIGDRTGLTTDSDGGLTANAVSLDAYDNFVADVPVAWSLTGLTGVLPPSTIATAAVDFITPGIGVLHASDATLGSAATGMLTVVPGRVAVLAITPPTQTLSADDPPFAFSVSATDADGNATTNLGTLMWSVASGPISQLAATGVLDPQVAGTGTIAVTSSWGPTATSGAITITPGAPATVVLAPPSLTISADAAPVAFTADVRDGDGNVTSPGSLTWTTTGPITALGTTGVFDPTVAGTGTVTATTANNLTASAPITVTPGHAATLVVSPPTLVTSQGAAPVAFTATASDADGNATADLGTLAWTIASGPIGTLDGASGMLTPAAAGTGTIKVTSSFGASATTGTVQILRAAALQAVLAVPATVSVGQTFSVAMTVTNPGEDVAANVTACALAIGGIGAATIVSSPGPVASLAGGGNATLTWTVTATAAGSLAFSTCATATDAVTGAPINVNASGSATALVPPQLAATISVPPIIGRGASFAVTMVVTNSGQVAANAVTPGALSVTGTGAATLVSSPAGAVTVGAGGTTTFSWTYKATTTGTLQLHGAATGTDAVSGAAVATPAAGSNVADVVEAYTAVGDPFGDGSTFAFVAGYRGEVYAGTNKAGNAAIRIAPDATNLEALTFAFARDASGNTSANTATPYTSIGSSGCTHDTSGCGPDNEDLRGLFTSVTFGGTEWLIASGAAAAVNAAYIYMTTSTGTTLAYDYVDLSNVLTSSYGASAFGVVGNRLYVGTAGTSGGRSQLIAVTTVPTAPGLDAGGGDATDMHLERIGSWAGGSNPEHVDAIAGVTGIAYAANKNAWVRAENTSPSPYPSLCLPLLCVPDWVDITPSASAYGAKASRSTAKGGNLEPIDRAVPQIALFQGRLFVARNTTAGPQLWACTPSGGKCNSNDWSLVAPNSAGDVQLTQFNDTTLTSITMLVATPSHLYVGFDSTAGAQVFRTASPAAATRAAFEGQNACSAANHPATCASYGGAGLGDVTNTRIFDAKAVASSVWLTTGSGSNAVALVELP